MNLTRTAAVRDPSVSRTSERRLHTHVDMYNQKIRLTRARRQLDSMDAKCNSPPQNL